jgi:hypothetical protein
MTICEWGQRTSIRRATLNPQALALSPPRPVM